MEQAVEDGVAEGGIADDVMPVIEGKLAGDEGGLTAVAVLKDLEQISAFGLAERSQPEVVDGKQLSALESVEEPGVGAPSARARAMSPSRRERRK